MPKKKAQEKETEEQSQPKLFLVIRVRGAPHMNYKIEDTLKMLRLHKVNHGTILIGNKTNMGMLKKVKDYVAFGEITEEVLEKLLRKRVLLVGNKPLTEEHIKNKTEFSDIKSLVAALMEGKIKFKDIYNVKPIFRLHPPRGGYRGSIKKPFNAGGTLGNVGSYINELALRML
ncbi:MAG: 50S ribosomal protein L30 [Promethearchaeota archaeon]